jgi:hypothetical protein
VGLRIEPGITREVKGLFRRDTGYTHISEPIPPMVSTVFQGLWANSDFVSTDPAAPDGQVVRTYFPVSRKERKESTS